jgi:hypothetical protein
MCQILFWITTSFSTSASYKQSNCTITIHLEPCERCHHPFAQDPSDILLMCWRLAWRGKMITGKKKLNRHASIFLHSSQIRALH